MSKTGVSDRDWNLHSYGVLFRDSIYVTEKEKTIKVARTCAAYEI